MRKVVLATTTILITAAFFTSCSKDQDKNAPTAPGIPADTTIAPWDRTYGTLADDYATAVTTNDDGEIFVLGETSTGTDESDLIALKLSSDGDVIWQATIDMATQDLSGGIFARNDGTVLVVGTSLSTGESSARILWVILSDSGEVLSSKLLSEPGVVWGSISVAVATGNGYVFQGNADLSSGGEPCSTFVMKVDSQGDLDWKRYFAGPSCQGPDFFYPGAGIANGVSSNHTDGTINFAWFCVGRDVIPRHGIYPQSCSGRQEDLYLHKLNSDGNTVWQESIAKWCRGRSVLALGEDDIAVLKTCPPENKDYVEIFTSAGSLMTSSQILSPHSGSIINSMVSVSNGLLVVGGTDRLYYGVFDVSGNSGADVTLEDESAGTTATEASDGSWIIAGNKPSADSSLQMYVLKVDPM